MSFEELPPCCPACRSDRSRIWNLLSRGPVQECTSCRSLWVVPTEIDSSHESAFYEGTEENFAEYFEPLRKNQYRQTFDQMRLKRGMRHLDVGCSYGWLVQAGLDMGLDSYGIESGAVDFPSQLKGRIQQVSLQAYVSSHPSEKYDLISLWHVLEHFPSPESAVLTLKKILQKQGEVLIAVPSRDGRLFSLAALLSRLRYRTLLENLFYTHNRNMHFIYFTEKGLRRLLERNGFRVERILYLPNLQAKNVHYTG